MRWPSTRSCCCPYRLSPVASVVGVVFAVAVISASCRRPSNESEARNADEPRPDMLRILAELYTDEGANSGPARALLADPRAPLWLKDWRSAAVRVLVGTRPAQRVWLTNPSGDVGGRPTPVRMAAFSPDSRWIVTVAGKRAWTFRADGRGTPNVLRGHRAALTSAVFSSDGRRVITASADGTARVWKADGSGSPFLYREHRGPVNQVAVGVDDVTVLTVSSDRTARIWRLDGTGASVVLEHHDEVKHGAFSPDGRRIATAAGNEAYLWTVDGAKAESVPLRGHAGPLTSIRFSADGRWLLTTSVDGSARVWKVENTEQAYVLRLEGQAIESASIDDDGNRVVTGSPDGILRIWRISGSSYEEFGVAGPGVPVFAEGVDGQFWTASADGSVREWDSWGRYEEANVWYAGHVSAVTSMVVSPDRRHLLTASKDGSVRLWPTRRAVPTEIACSDSKPTVIASAPDGRLLVGAGLQEIRICSPEGSSQPQVHDIDADADRIRVGESVFYADNVSSVAFSPDGSRFAVGTAFGFAYVFEPKERRDPVRLVGHTGIVSAIAFSPDGQTVITGSHDRTVRVWRIDGQGDPLVLNARRPAQPSSVTLDEYLTRRRRSHVSAVAFSPKGRRILASTGSGVYVWPASGQGRPVVLHEGRIAHAAFSPDGTRVVIASEDGAARVWNADGSGEPVVLKKHPSPLTWAAFSPDGTRIVTASKAGVVQVWPADGRGEPMVMDEPSERVKRVRFGPNGVNMVTAREYGTAVVHRLTGDGSPLTLDGGGTTVEDAVFSPDGEFVIVANESLTRWPVTAASLRVALLKDVEPCLTPDERMRYLQESKGAAVARWRGCEKACWGRRFSNRQPVAAAVCPRGERR